MSATSPDGLWVRLPPVCLKGTNGQVPGPYRIGIGSQQDPTTRAHGFVSVSWLSLVIRLVTLNRPASDRVRVTPGFVPIEHSGAGWYTNYPAPLPFQGMRVIPWSREAIILYQTLSPSR